MLQVFSTDDIEQIRGEATYYNQSQYMWHDEQRENDNKKLHQQNGSSGNANNAGAKNKTTLYY